MKNRGKRGLDYEIENDGDPEDTVRKITAIWEEML